MARNVEQRKYAEESCCPLSLTTPTPSCSFFLVLSPTIWAPGNGYPLFGKLIFTLLCCQKSKPSVYFYVWKFSWKCFSLFSPFFYKSKGDMISLWYRTLKLPQIKLKFLFSLCSISPLQRTSRMKFILAPDGQRGTCLTRVSPLTRAWSMFFLNWQVRLVHESDDKQLHL